MTSRILGTGSYVPNNIVTNDHLSTLVDTSDEWITERTGIQQRRIASGENTTSMAIVAAKEALLNANVSANEIELILVATFTPNNSMPNTACQVQAALLAHHATCFDLNAACTGFIYALQTAHAYISSGLIKTALIIGSEVISKVVDWTDRSTCVLFGDGAGAAVIGADNTGIISIVSGSDGTKGSALTCKNPISNLSYENAFSVKGNHTLDVSTKRGFEPEEYGIFMDGQEVFKFATRIIPEIILKLITDANLKIEELKTIILHQANKRILQSAAKRLNISEEAFPMNLDKYGNTSAASLGILLDEINRKGKLERGNAFILAGFGGGLTWGGVLLHW